MGGRRHGLRCVTAPALDFGILTETKDSETATVESSFTVTSAYTAEDFVSDTRSEFLACVTEDFGEQVASEAASLVDGQIASMSWYRRFEIWNDLASYDICGVANADHLIDGLEELSVALADGRAFDANGGNPVFHAFHRAERQSGDRELPVPARRTHRHHWDRGFGQPELFSNMSRHLHGTGPITTAYISQISLSRSSSAASCSKRNS